MKIGFIGLGHMGQPMALNLIKAQFPLYVYDVLPSAMERLVAHGAHATTSVAELVTHVDVVITSVQTSTQVEALCLGEEGIFKHAHPALLYIDCSSIDITMTRLLHETAKQHHIAMLDAPVSGGVAGATAGSLTFMVGGEATVYERALPVLERMGKKIVHAGVGGSGQAAKICNNLLLAVSMIGVCEAFNLAEQLGLDTRKFFEISSNSSGQCWSMTSYCPVPGLVESAPSNRGYAPGFTANMMLKDLRLGQHAAEAVGASIPLGAAASELYELFVNQGHGELDFSGMIRFLSKQCK
jgi:3-hydroxyisobutyrate dehydrogenase